MSSERQSIQFESGYLAELLQTKLEAQEFIEQIEQLLNSLYNIKTPINEKIDTVFSSQKKKVLEQIIKKYGIDSKSLKSFEINMKSLIDVIKKIQTISLTLAVEPDEKIINKITAWLKTNVDYPLILDLSRKQSTIAGAIIGLNGKYYDHTLQNLLQKASAQTTKK